MTIWGIDASHYQPGLSVGAVAAQGYDFVIAKCTEGQGYVDPAYTDLHAQAAAARRLFAAYHWLHSDSSPTAQANNLAIHIGDKSVPVWIDMEPTRTSRPTLRNAAAFRAACANRGISVVGIYYPHWYWLETGSPDLTGWTLWQSIYGPNLPGHAAAVYPGDESVRWAAQGGVRPTILQFGSRGQIDGYSRAVDVDAFRGTRDEIVGSGLFKDYGPRVPQKVVTPYAVKALESNRQHAADLAHVVRGTGGPLDLAIRGTLAALSVERRLLVKRVRTGK